MKPCDYLPHYLDGRLERAGREYFESHLTGCPDCRKLMNVWACTKNVLKNEAAERRQYLVPTDEEASRLVQRAVLDASSRGIFGVRVLVPLTACISFALAFVLASQLNKAHAPSSLQARSPHETTLDTGEKGDGTSGGVVASADVAAPIDISVQRGPVVEYETKADGRTLGRLGNDRFGLAALSRLRVLSAEGKTTLLRIERGRAAFSVSKRFGQRQFVVEAGDYRVVVVGTKFSVDNGDEGVRVSVSEGVVRVLENGGREWRVSAGEALSVLKDGTVDRTEASSAETQMIAALLGEVDASPVGGAETADARELETAVSGRASLSDGTNRKKGFASQFRATARSKSASSGKEAPDDAIAIHPDEGSKDSASASAELILPEKTPQGMELWRQWVLQGRFAEAEGSLTKHLADHPVDPEAYSLLADCQRKAGRYAEAVETYKKLTAIASDNQANRARFMAGVLMQENLKNHLGAAAIFDEYLSTGKGTPILRAKASVRLASSLIEVGELERAKRLLSRIADDYRGTSIGIQAKEMLDKIR